MTRARATIRVEVVREMANQLLRTSDSLPPEFRKGVAAMAMNILHESGNYRGFNYVEWLEGGCRRWQEDGMPDNKASYLGDESRIRLF